MTVRRLRNFLLLAVLAVVPSFASAATSEFRVLFDVDNNPSTGCTVGTMNGIDQVFVTQATNGESTAGVVQTYRLVCTAGALGAPIAVDTTAWPATVDPTTGNMIVETRVPFTAFQASGLPSNMHVAFTAIAGSASQALTTGPGGAALLFPTATPGRRRAVDFGDPRMIVIDGQMADWGTILPLASREIGGGDTGFQFMRVWAFVNPVDQFVYFSFQARVGTGTGPTANDDDYVRNQGQPLVVPVTKGVLKNDVDPNGEPMTATKVSEANHGNVTLNPDGSFQYLPTNPASVEVDHFTYTASNSTATSNTAKVTIEVNDRPKIKNTTLTVAENVPNGTVVGPVDVTDEAGDAHTFSIINGNTGGAFAVTALPNGDAQISVANRNAVNFEVNPTFTLTLKVTDEGGLSDTGLVTINVTNMNDAPVASNSSRSVPEDQLLTVPAPGLFSLTSDEDGNTLTLSIVANPAHGIVTLNPDGSYTYDSNPNYNGPDSFTWRAFDGTTFSNTATVSITVTPVNDAPSFTGGGNVNSPEDTAYSAAWATAISAGPSDEAGQTLSFTVVAATPALFSTQPAIDAGGNLTFVPAANANGSSNVDVTLVDNGGGTNSSGTVTFTITITPVNDVPSFVKGSDLVVLDTDGAQAVAGWATSLSAGPANESGQLLDFIVSNDSPALFTVAPAIASNGTLSFTPAAGTDGIATVTVQIHDNGGTAGGGVDTSGAQTFTITIEKIPTITSANTTTFVVGQAGTFSVTTTGRPKPDIAETGTLPSGVTFVDGSGPTKGTGTLAGTPAALTGGSYPITFQATNTRGSSPVQNFTLIINEAPGITSANSATFTQGSPGSFTVTTTGYPDPTLALSGATLPTGLTFTDNLDGTATLSGTPTAAGGSYGGFTITASNGVGSNAVQSFTIIINQAPAITSANSTGFNAGTATTFTVTTSGYPAPSLGETGALPAGATFTDNGNGTATIAWNGTNGSGGVYGITITATNVAGSAPQSFTITVCNTIVVTNPVTASGPAGSPFSQTFTQTGAVGSATFTLNSGTLPTGLTLAANGTLSGTPTQAGSFPITVLVTDANACTGVGSTYTLVITCPTITVTNPVNANGTASSAFSETFTQTGGVGATTFSLASGTLPTGLTLAANGVLSGTPTQTGSFPITVTATDSNGCTGTGTTYTIVIACQTITVNNPANANGTASSAFSETFTNSGAIGATTYSLASGTLPAGLTLASSGVLSGTPTQTGSFPITVTATDSNGCTGTSSTYTIVIACQTINVANPVNTNGAVSAPFSETFTQTAAIGTATFTTASTLPAGLTLATNGTLSGTPTQTGSFPIVVTVTDSNGCTGTGSTYTLVIGCQTITVTKPVNTNGTVSAAFSETFTQSGAVGGATFTLNSGVLPAGLTLSAAGVLSGTPTQSGSFPITVKVTDGNGCTGTSTTYTLVIACQTITVTNPVNATGPAGTPFSETFTQTGGIGAVTFTTASTLPTGLTLSAAGVLSGTPSQGGTFPITVTATDSNGCTGTGSTYNLVITCPTITVTKPVNTNGTAGSAFSETFTQSGGIGTITYTLASGTLPTGLTLGTNGVLSGTPTQTGSFPITVTATDQNGCTGTSSTYTLVIACQTITVSNPGVASGVANAAFSQTFTQSGGIGSTTFSLNSGVLPAGLTLAANGVLSGTPTQTGSFPITVKATDSNGCTGTGSTYTLIISCQTITVTKPVNTNGSYGVAFSETFTQSGAIGTATFTTASTLPTGLTLSTAGVLSGTPTQPGTFPIVVTVTDSNGCTGTSTTYNLVIACQTITVTKPVNANGTVGTPFSETFTQSGAIGSATFTTASTLPAGLTLSAAGVLSGTPTQAGNFPITVTVTDSNGCTGTSTTYNLVIACQVITVTNPGVTTGTVDAAFSQTFTQSGAIGSATFTTASTLPSGLTLSTAGVLSGTPGQPGTFPIVVTVTDSNGCTGTSSTYTLVIGCQTITVNNPATTTGTVDAAFSQTFTQTGVGTHTPATFTTSSTLPSGLTLSTAGVLSGTPGQPGTFPITVTVTDVNGCTGTSATYNLVIACQTITVNNPGVTTATYNSAFSQTFTQTGVGTHTPATFTTSSTLPTGLTLSTAGVLSGTPTQTGTFPITVTVTDANGCSGTGGTYTLSVAPVANADSYSNGVNNTQFVLTGGTTTTPSTPSVQVAGTIATNDLPSGAVSVVAGTFATTGGGSVTIAADGTFLYTPPAAPGGAAIASDTFQYTVTSNTGGTGPVTSAPATVTINLANRVWYVKNDAAGGGNGQSQLPFNTLAAAAAASTANDYIYVYFGNGTNSGQSAGITLKSGQKLYGQGIALVVNAQTLVSAGSQALIGNSAGAAVTATNISGVEVKGLSISANTDGVFASTTAANSGGIEIANNTITAAGQSGIQVDASGSGTFTASIHDNIITSTGNGMDLVRSAGNFYITAFDDNTIGGNSAASGIVVTGATFDAIPGAGINQVSGGNTVIGASGNGVGATGMQLVTVTGDLLFNDLDIYADGGVGLRVTGSGSMTFGVAAGVGVVEANAGPAIDITSVALTLPLTSIVSTNSSTTGVALNSITGSFSAGAASSISALSSAAATAFQVGSSNATISYAGTISITQGKGVDLTSNTGSTIAFTGTLTLSTGASNAFNATGGGTVSSSDTASTITTTTGTAINVANTNIGASNLRFRSVTAGTAGSGPTNAIVLNTTGVSGSLIISGTGSSGTGGTIQKTTGVGILLTSTENPQFNWMNILNAGDDGIRGSTVNNMTLSNCTLTTNGNAAAENGLQLGEASGSIVGITGTLTMSGTTITGSAGNNVHIRNTSGTLTAMNITNCSFNNLNDTTGANSFLFEASGTSTTVAATLTNVTFDNNSPQRALEVQSHDSASIGDFTVTGSTFNNNGIHASFTQDTTSSIRFSVLNSNFQIADPLHAINVFSSSTSTSGTVRGTIEGNTIGSAGTSSSGAKGNAIRVLIQGRTQGIFKINNNTIRQVWLAGNGARGMDLQFLGPTAGAQPITQSDITITNNDVDTMAPGSSFPLAPIYLSADNQGSPARVRAQITGNNARNSVSGSYDYPTFDGNGAFLIFNEVTAGAEGQLVDTGAASGTALSELQTANPATTSTKIYESGIALIAGPISLP